MTTLEIPAKSEPLSLEPPRTALVVVDMRNAFASRGGMLDLAGIDVTPAHDAVANARLVCEAARSAGMAVVIVKSRYSGFHGTNLDSVLRSRGIRNLWMVGIASNVCVESTLRDAYFNEYWPILIADATMPAGSAEIPMATVYNVKTFFGWVASSEDVATVLREATKPRP